MYRRFKLISPSPKKSLRKCYSFGLIAVHLCVLQTDRRTHTHTLAASLISRGCYRPESRGHIITNAVMDHRYSPHTSPSFIIPLWPCPQLRFLSSLWFEKTKCFSFTLKVFPMVSNMSVPSLSSFDYPYELTNPLIKHTLLYGASFKDSCRSRWLVGNSFSFFNLKWFSEHLGGGAFFPRDDDVCSPCRRLSPHSFISREQCSLIKYFLCWHRVNSYWRI